MSNHWFEDRGCPACKHVWQAHCASDAFLRRVQPYVVNEEHVCPQCKHEFIHTVVHHYARPGYGIDLDVTEGAGTTRNKESKNG
jgi:hypothetical protein